MAGQSSKRHGLGRGLGALIISTEGNPAGPEVLAQAAEGGVQLVSVDRIEPNPHQPRTLFSQDALEELAASIRAHGIIQPLIVTAAPADRHGYWLVAGERRWRAARLAGLVDVPVIVREVSPQQLMEWALVENLQRADLNPLEEATAYQTLINEFGLTQAEVADRVGKSRSAVANTVRLLNLPNTIQAAVVDGRLSAGHARALLSLPSAEIMQACLVQIVSKGLNVRQTEELVKRLLAAPASAEESSEQRPQPELDAQMRHLEARFRSSLGTRVALSRNPDGTGKLVIHFYSDDDLETLYQRMVGNDAL